MILDSTINVIITVINTVIIYVLIIYNIIDNIVSIIYMSACMCGKCVKKKFKIC